MAYRIRVNGEEKWMARQGELTTDEARAMYYPNPSHAKTLIKRWAIAHPDVKLTFEKWIAVGHPAAHGPMTCRTSSK